MSRSILKLLMSASIACAVLILAESGTAEAAHHYPDTPIGVYDDCVNNGALTQTFSESVLARTLAQLKTQALQYTDCGDVIRAAELAGLPSKTTTTHTHSTASGSGKKKHARGRIKPNAGAAARNGGRKVNVNGHVVQAGAVTLHDGSLFGSLPTPLLVALLALLAGGLAFGARSIRNHGRDRQAP